MAAAMISFPNLGPGPGCFENTHAAHRLLRIDRDALEFHTCPTEPTLHITRVR
jgi:hypothetical protein